MKLIAKKSFAVIVVIIFAVPLISASGADSADLSAKDLTPLFLSDVVELDLTKYNITNEGYSSEYPSYYGGEVNVEVRSFDLVSERGNLSVMGMFYNNFIYRLIVYYVNGSVIYSREQSTNAVEESRTMLQRYKAFAQNLGYDISHVDQASNMLSKVSSAPSKDNLYMFNDIVGFVPSVSYNGNMKQETTEKSVSWIYTEQGTSITNKCLSINFGSNKLSFADKWNLYKVGSPSAISEEEAKSVGWEAAKKYNLIFTYENGTTVPVTPKWSNVSEITFSMIPGQMYKMDPNSNVNPGSVTREPLSLYPHWQMKFYFEMIGQAAGLQVGVWGDTKEIAYINLFGYLGSLGVPETSSTPEPQPQNSPDDSTDGFVDNSAVPTLPPTNEPSPEVTQPENVFESVNGNQSTIVFLIGGLVTATAAAIAIVFVVLKKRRK